MGHFPEGNLLRPTSCWAMLHIARAFFVPSPGLGEPGEDSCQVSAQCGRQAWTLSADRSSAGHRQRAFWNIVQGLRGRQNIAPGSSAGIEERGISRAPRALPEKRGTGTSSLRERRAVPGLPSEIPFQGPRRRGAHSWETPRRKGSKKSLWIIMIIYST